MIDGSDLQLSKFYFTVIQILRLAADWIQESMNDLRRTVEDMERLYLLQAGGRFPTFVPVTPDNDARDLAIKTFRHNWEVVLSDQKRRGDALLSRIAIKQEGNQESEGWRKFHSALKAPAI